MLRVNAIGPCVVITCFQFHINCDGNVNIKDSATQGAPSVKIIDVTLGELNIMLQKAGADARKKGEDQILQITSRVEIRYEGGWVGKRARSFDFIPVCSVESAFFCLPLVDLPFSVARRPPDTSELRQRSFVWRVATGVSLFFEDFPFWRSYRRL